MQILLILLCLFGNTEFFNKHGKKIGEDKHGKDEKIAIIIDKKVAKLIAQEYQDGKLVSKTNPRITIKTTKTVLKEALHTLERTENNGGLREECSIVTAEGKIFRAETGDLPDIKNGVQVAEVALPKLTKRNQTRNATSIHSHLTKLELKGQFFYPQTIVNPSFDPDLWAFANYGTNIIVGNLRQSYITWVGNEMVTMNSPKGIAIYKKGRGDKAVLVLSRRVVQKILK
jgi:hypothetical protein